ncbi:MnmC family methyltransferase [Cyanobium sp. FGCU-52]|nr:MnmC family methyltransferase [Cyanobium sp. FGCU52]
MPEGGLQARLTADGSFSLFSDAVGEGFHSADGALAEARAKFVLPAGLERFAPGGTLQVVEVAVGTGTNTAALLEATRQRGLALSWWGLERDPEPLRLALADGGFRRQWPPEVLSQAEALGASDRLLWGDARTRLVDLPTALTGACDLVLLDAFSPRRSPELWTVEFLAGLARLLAPQGRLLTYCSAAAVRRALAEAGLQLAAIRAVAPHEEGAWSGGTVASPSPLASDGVLRGLSPMEREHMASRAGEPYRDPHGQAGAAEILAARARAQAVSGAESGSAWQRRLGGPRHHRRPRTEGMGGQEQDR